MKGNGMNKHFTKIPILLAAVSILLSCSQCSSVRFVSDYDETTDVKLTEIQLKTADFINTLIKSYGSNAASYDSCQNYYNEIRREIETLEFRVNSIPDNKYTIETVKQIRFVILGGNSDSSGLRGIHALPENRRNGIDPTTLSVTKRIIDQAISAALKLEIAKKRGKD
jgi:hypothetical protein